MAPVLRSRERNTIGSFRFDYRYDYGYETDRLVMDHHIYYMNTSHLVYFALAYRQAVFM